MDLPPQNLEAESAILGAMLLNPQAIEIATDVGLQPEDFHLGRNRVLYDTIRRLAERDAVDELTVINELRTMGQLEEVGEATVAALVENVPAIGNARAYAEIVREQSIRRRLVETGQKIAGLGYDSEGTRELVDRAEQLVYDIAHERESSDFIQAVDLLSPIYDALSERAMSGDKGLGVGTGFRDFDKLTGGFGESQLVIVGARASMGKTSWALNVAEHVALREKKPVAVFSLEMDAKELVVRMMCSVAKVDQHRVRVDSPHDEDWPLLVDAVGRIAEARDRLFIDETAGITPFELRSKARRLDAKLKSQGGLSMIIIDYLQLMSAGKWAENRQVEVSQISRALKSLARELKVPIIALSQLSRGLEQRTDKRPMMSDLRESGSLEQDADMVIFIHRPDYYDRDNPELKGKAEIIVAKNRNGRTGIVEVAFLDKYTKFVDIAREHHHSMTGGGAPAGPRPGASPAAPAAQPAHAAVPGPPPPGWSSAADADDDGVF